jgi:hypothetical protein
MNLLFRLNQKVEDTEDTKEFFKNILPNRDNSHFFNVNKLQKVDLGDTIYFAHSGYIVAEATFAGEDFIHVHHIVPISEIGKNY